MTNRSGGAQFLEYAKRAPLPWQVDTKFGKLVE